MSFADKSIVRILSSAFLKTKKKRTNRSIVALSIEKFRRIDFNFDRRIRLFRCLYSDLSKFYVCLWEIGEILAARSSNKPFYSRGESN